MCLLPELESTHTVGAMWARVKTCLEKKTRTDWVNRTQNMVDLRAIIRMQGITRRHAHAEDAE